MTKKQTGIYIENSDDNKVFDNKVHGADIGIHVKDSDRVEVYDNMIQSLSEEDINNLKKSIVKEIESILSDSQKGKGSDKIKHLIQFVSAFGSATLVELFKSYGLIPPNNN